MIKEEKVKLSRTKKLELNARNNTNSISCDDSTKLLVPRNGRKKLNIYN